MTASDGSIATGEVMSGCIAQVGSMVEVQQREVAGSGGGGREAKW